MNNENDIYQIQKSQEVNIDLTDLSPRSIPKIFASENDYSFNMNDLIAYIRSHVRNPWSIITVRVKDLEEFPSVVSLRDSNIYIYSSYDQIEAELLKHDRASIESPYILVTDDDIINSNLNSGQDIINFVDTQMQIYGVENVTVLVYVLNIEKYSSILNDIFSIAQEPNRFIILPDKINRGRHLDKSSIDITSIIAKCRHDLYTPISLKIFGEIEDAVKEEKANGKTKMPITGSLSERSVGLIQAYLTVKYNLDCQSDVTYRHWISKFHMTYMYKHMSFYERLNFIKKLPSQFLLNTAIARGNTQYACRICNNGKVLPNVVSIYDFDTCERVEEKDIPIDWLSDNFIDYRTLFKDSGEFTKEPTGSSNCADYADYETDKMLIDKFISMDPDEFINIKNSVLYKYNGKIYLIYTVGEFKLSVLAHLNGICPEIPFEIKEKEFDKIYIPQAVSLRDHKYRVPLLPGLTSYIVTELYRYNIRHVSYYEKALRMCSMLDENVDEITGEVFDLFQYIPLRRIREEELSRYKISAFGNILYFDVQFKDRVALPVTYKVFKDVILK